MTIRTWVFSVLLVLVCWIGVQAVVMRFSDVAPGAIALFPSSDFVTRLPPKAAVLGAGSFWVAVRFDGLNLGQALYGAGALLVLPAGLPGCLPLPSFN